MGRGGVGRASCRFAGVAMGVTCRDGAAGRRARLVDVSGPESVAERLSYVVDG